MAEYAHPEVLVETSWVAEHLQDPSVRVVEVDVDTHAYEEAHVPGAIGWNWRKQLCDTRMRDILPRGALERLMSESGCDRGTTVVLYGDNNNWFACWAFWQLKIFGHADVRIMNGGRNKWLAEGREVSLEVPRYPARAYVAAEADNSIRAFLPDVMAAIDRHSAGLVDVRSPAEYTGVLLAPPGLPETCQRGGHIPGACNITWESACRADGTFKPVAELDQLYASQGITAARPTIAYCRIGERSSHTWFVLKYLLGHPDVRNYDGSWTEWGNLVRAPIER